MKMGVWKAVVSVIAAIALVVGGSVGVSFFVNGRLDQPTSATVKDGLSAYELAVQYGYEGTVQEWLASLTGKSAYDVAVENGYSGTAEQWIASLKATAGKDGVGIKTAAFSGANELLITLSDDTVLNLGTAAGKDGANGTDGEDGKDGADGKDGVDGQDGVGITAATINTDGQLLISFSDGRQVNLDKVVGMNGADGIGIASSVINANGELVITYSNDQIANLGPVIGAKGDKGDQGAQGEKGEQGAQGVQGEKGDKGDNGVSVADTVINNRGELVITLSDNTVKNLGVVIGAKGDKGDTGAQGEQGIQGEKGDKGDEGDTGAAGQDGISVTGAEINSEGQLVLTFSNNQRTNLGNVIGAKGDKGDTGAQGVQGDKGDKGDTGAQGAQGEKGDKGDKGDTGAQGEKGDKGDKGDTGAAGVSVVDSTINARGELVITLSNNTVQNLGVVVGAKGEKGDKGDTGAQGEQGIQGEKGDKGDTGAQGEQGIQGEKGDKGDTGAQGEQGIQGEKGDKGDTGAQGEQGIQGEKGDKGDAGADGEDGVGIATIVIDNGNLKITLTNETTLDLGNIKGADGEDGADGEKGEKGDKGDKGDAGEDGEDGANGVGVASTSINAYGELVIVYTDGNEVNLGKVVGANGQDGAQGEKGDKGDTGADGVGVSKTEINADGELVITYTNGTAKNLGVVVGAKGEKGDKGDQGEQGDQGEKGDKGDQGEQGIQGEKGDKGDQGEQGIQGEKGDKGDTGEQGIQGEKGDKGEDGQDGIDGVGVSKVELLDNELVITLSNTQIINLGNIKGEKGDKGDTGAQGQQGIQGIQGEKGDPGADGVSITNVTLTAEGELSMTFSSGATVDLGNVKGADGADGVGVAAAKIENGMLMIRYTNADEFVTLGTVKGDKGDQGEPGEKGDKGDKGDQGEQGIQGETGRGILRTEVSGTNLIVYYTDGTSETLDLSTIISDPNEKEVLVFSKLADGTYGVMAGGMAKYEAVIEIPATYNGIAVTQILPSGFKDLSLLQNVTIPNSVTVIDHNAFQGCFDLDNVVLPSSLKKINPYAFNGCTSLSSIVIPDSVTVIDNNVFQGCTGLYNIVLPSTLKKINSYAFNGCTSLSSIVIPTTTTFIGKYAFYEAALTSATLQDVYGWITEPLVYVYNSTPIYTSNISGSTTTTIFTAPYPDYSLSPANAATALTTRVHYYAYLSASSTSKQYLHFDAYTVDWTNPTTLDESVSYTEGLEYTLLSDGTYAVSVGSATDTNIIIPPMYNNVSVTTIAAHGFEGITDLESVVLPVGITTIDSYAFNGCTTLSINICSTVQTVRPYALKGVSSIVVEGSNLWTVVGMSGRYEGSYESTPTGKATSQSLTVSNYNTARKLTSGSSIIYSPYTGTWTR